MKFPFLPVRHGACVTVLACCASLPAHAERSVYNFNPGWRLAVADPAGAADTLFDDKAWKAVTLPRAWNEDDAFARDIADHSTGVAWYRKHFTRPAAARGQKVFIEFEGARQAAEVFVNGKRIGLHDNGINAFGFDISEALVDGDNVVAVRTDNDWAYREKASGQRFQWSDKNFNANYGGLPKNVRLHVTDKLYQTLPLYSTLGTTGVYVYARDFDIAGGRATIAAESEVRNDHADARTFSYQVRLRDRDGKQVALFSSKAQTLAPGATTVVTASAAVKGLHFWSWGYGYLYDVVTTLKVDGREVDSVTTRTGFRKTEYGHGMVRLNDRVLQMKGYAQRTSNEWPALGMSVPAWLSDYSNGLALDSNANLIRWMHITPWKQDVESLDRIGLMQAMPAGDSEADVTGRRWEQRIAAMTDSIIYNRNSPSILFYESGNAGISEAHMQEMRALRDRFDPFGGRASGSRSMLSAPLQKVAEYGGEMLYINKSANNPMWAMEYSRDEAARKFWDELTAPQHKEGEGPKHKGEDASAYNRNMDSQAIEDVKRWYDYWRERPGTGTRVSAGGVNIIFSDSNTHHRGAENYRRSGEVDAMRIPKDGYYAHQVMWDGWVDVEKPRATSSGTGTMAPAPAQSMSAAGAQTSNARLKALAAAAAAMTAKDAVQDLDRNGPSAKISLAVGHSESESSEVTASRTHAGSVLAAGNNIAIGATGGGKASNLDIVGSDVPAAGNVSLAADNQVNMLAAQDKDSQHSQSKSWSAAVGVGFEISPGKVERGITASASASRGNVDGEGTAQVNSDVTAGDRLTIASGGDTNLKRAV